MGNILVSIIDITKQYIIYNFNIENSIFSLLFPKAKIETITIISTKSMIIISSNYWNFFIF